MVQFNDSIDQWMIFHLQRYLLKKARLIIFFSFKTKFVSTFEILGECSTYLHARCAYLAGWRKRMLIESKIIRFEIAKNSQRLDENTTTLSARKGKVKKRVATRRIFLNTIT